MALVGGPDNAPAYYAILDTQGTYWYLGVTHTGVLTLTAHQPQGLGAVAGTGLLLGTDAGGQYRLGVTPGGTLQVEDVGYDLAFLTEVAWVQDRAGNAWGLWMTARGTPTLDTTPPSERCDLYFPLIIEDRLMPPRCIDSDIKAILDTTMDTTPFIIVAALMIDTHLTAANLETTLLFELERWLAAHFACIRDPRFLQVRSDSVGMTYQQSKAGQGLDATSYGQQAKLLDPTGILDQVTTATRPAYIRVN